MKLNKIILILTIISNLLFASSMQEINKQAVNFLEANKPAKAYNLLEEEYKNNNFDNQTLFLLGTSAKQNGDFKNAIKYFEILLTKDKGAMRVRLDLAMIYYKTQNLKKAKELLLIVKASNPPKKVGDNVNSFLATIAQGVPKSYSLSASIGYMYDSNVNAGPSTDTVLMYNLPFTLNDDAKETSDWAMKYGVGINHMKRFKSFSLQSSANFNMTDYHTLNNLDNYSLSVSSGPTWKQNKQTTLSIPVIFNITKIGHSNDDFYSISGGISPQVSYQKSQKLSLSASLSLNKKHYYQNPQKESHSWTFSPSSKYFLDQTSYIVAGGYIGQDDSKTSTSSTDSKGVNLSYNKSFSKKLNLNLSTSFSNTKYGGVEVAYDKSREDDTSTYGANVSYYVSEYKMNISTNVSYTKNNSNIEMYDYDRTQVGISASFRF